MAIDLMAQDLPDHHFLLCLSSLQSPNGSRRVPRHCSTLAAGRLVESKGMGGLGISHFWVKFYEEDIISIYIYIYSKYTLHTYTYIHVFTYWHIFMFISISYLRLNTYFELYIVCFHTITSLYLYIYINVCTCKLINTFSLYGSLPLVFFHCIQELAMNNQDLKVVISVVTCLLFVQAP